MEPERFNVFTRSLSSRLSRRTALRASGLGLAASLVAASPFAAKAQDATPDPPGDDTTFVFVQSAASGTFAANPGAGTPTAVDGAPVAGGGADYLLTLKGHTGNTVYFSDLPGRIFGEAPTQTFLDGLGFSPNNPPNAALVTTDENGDEDILVVELLEPTYDGGSGTVTYGVNILSDYAGDGLAHVASRQQDEDLAPAFGQASLFIDDCADVSACYRFTDLIHTETIGPLPAGVNPGRCWSWLATGCEPCNGWSLGQFQQACDAAYPDCQQTCTVDNGEND